MAESFVLRYPLPGDTADEAEWISVDGNGAPAGVHGHGSLAAAAQAIGSRRLIVIVPGEDVTLCAPELPARAGAKILKLVPFALEEQLAADIESIHFAVGRQGADRRVPVAAIERTQFAEWLRHLASAGLTPQSLIADALVVPQNPAHVVLVIDRGRLIVRRPDGQPLVLDAEPLEAALAIAGLGSTPDGSAATAHVIVYASAAGWEAHAPAIDALRDSVASLKVQLLADGPLPLFAAGAVNALPFNLLQGEFQVRQGFGDDLARWRQGAILLAAALALHLLTLGVEYVGVHRDETKIDQELKVRAAEALPSVQNVSRLPSVRAAIEGRVRQARAAVNEGLLGTLGALAAATTAAPGTRIDSLSYRDGTTELTVDAPDVSALDKLRETTKSRGFNAELQGATQHDTRYQGRIEIKGPG